ncbi:hypothetical protein DVH24_030199 [Malus domestica]|uniref:RNase H type-1 domain-containing protein n=1 Tax=Malus domestica TaxID=3750 RepID=A0A498HV58_MALDO|nr:hypothetical protein DVH24_030199 [Malus domestica]
MPKPLFSPTTWSKPPLGWLKLNADGAFNAAGCVGGFGGVFRNHFGEFVDFPMFKRHLAGIMAAREVARLARTKLFHIIILECDSLQVTLSIGSLQLGNSPCSLVIEDVKIVLKSLLCSRIIHVQQCANVVADRLA